MGYPYNGLIAPAILLTNPGISGERFVELLDQTHSSCFREYKHDEPWDYYEEELEDESYHKGLRGLASVLCLEYSKKFKKFDKIKRDEYGLGIKPPFSWELDENEKNKYKFKVVVHEKNVIENLETTTEISWGKLNVGDIWQECNMGFETGFVREIYEEKYIGKEKPDDDEDGDSDPEDSGPQYQYKMRIAPIRSIHSEHLYRNEEELFKDWPIFDPENKYDWSQTNGHFSVTPFDNNFIWTKKGELYYLDDETFSRIPAGFNVLSYGYTDLIITAEAIRHNAWKLLSYIGKRHLCQFFRDFPDSHEKYSRAVWDSHTSLFAKSKNMSVSDFLRFRNTPF